MRNDLPQRNQSTAWPGWMRFAILLGAALFATLCFFGCNADKTELTQTTLAPQSAPNCASCHAYPPRDTNHVYHLFHVEGTITNSA